MNYVSGHLFKGSVQQKLSPRLLYIMRKLFIRRMVGENKILTFLKGTLHNLHKTPLAHIAQPSYFCLQM